jgi:transcriptional antiterminator NusG
MVDETTTPEPETPLADTGPAAAAPQPVAAESSAPEPDAVVAEPPSSPPTATAVAEPGDEEPGEAPPPAPSNKRWYVVKIQSGREESIKEAIERRVKIEGLEEYFGQIIIPTEKVTVMQKGKRVVKEHKLYPGYLMVEVEYNDRILYLFRETSGVGDFVGGGVNHPPPPMPPHEVERMLGPKTLKEGRPSKPPLDKGDRVKVKDGTFAGMEGEVKEILEAKGAVRVELTIFGRGVPVELEYWQVEQV